MRYFSLRFWLVLCLLGLTALGLVRAETAYGVDITDVQYESDQHDAIIISVSGYGAISAFASYFVELQEKSTGLVRTSNQYTLTPDEPQPDMRLRLQLSPTLPDGAYLIRLSARSIDDRTLTETSADFDHMRAGAVPTAQPTPAPVGSEFTPQDVPQASGALLIVAFIGTIAVIGIVAYFFRSHQKKVIKAMQQVAPVSKPGEPTIFISYSRTDWKDYVEPMIARLEAAGLHVWIDQHLLESGDDWLDRISHALETSDRMILCISPEALESRYVKLEYRYFFNHNKKIHPLLCRPVEEMPPELEGIQFFPYERLDDLIGILEREYAVKPPVTAAQL